MNESKFKIGDKVVYTEDRFFSKDNIFEVVDIEQTVSKSKSSECTYELKGVDIDEQFWEFEIYLKSHKKIHREEQLKNLLDVK